MSKNYYDILGVGKNASDQEIRKAFLKLSKKYHPDMQSGKSESEKKTAEEKFKEINEANEVLSDKEKRRNYDRFGKAEGGFSGFGAGGLDPREFFRKCSGFGNFHPFGNDFGFDDFGFENTAENDPNSPKDGRSVQLSIKFDLEDMLYGKTKKFNIQIEDYCGHCHGTGAKDGKIEKCAVCKGSGMETVVRGMMMIQNTCRNCHGTGYVAKDKCGHCNNGRIIANRDIEIKIPKGVSVGQRLMVKGKGESGLNGGNNGDVYVIVDINEHPIFKRVHDDLYETVYVSSMLASLGGDLEVQTPWGVENVKIPPGTENGKMIRLNEMGMKTQNGNGDLFAIVEIEPMTNLTDDQKNLIEQLLKTSTHSNFKKFSTHKRKCEDFRERTKMGAVS